MEINEIIRLVLIPFGGVSVVLVAMVGWLAHISTRRIVEGELAKISYNLNHSNQKAAKSSSMLKTPEPKK